MRCFVHILTNYYNDSNLQDIRSISLGDALLEAQILDYDLVRQIRDEMNTKKVFRGYSSEGGEYVLDERDGSTIADALKCLRADIRYFKWRNGVVGHTTMVYTPSISENIFPVYKTARDLLQAFDDYENYDSIVIPTWIVYATAALLEGCSFVCLNGSDSSHCPALYDLAKQQVGVYIIMGKASDNAVDHQLSNLICQHLRKTFGTSPSSIPAVNQLHDNSTITTTHKGVGFMNQAYTIQTTTATKNPLFTIPKIIDIAVWCDFFSGCSWSLDRVINALKESYDLDPTASKLLKQPNGNNDRKHESLLSIWIEAQAATESKQQDDVEEDNRPCNNHPSFVPSAAKSTTSSLNKKGRVRICLPQEHSCNTEWAIPHPRVICAGLACVDMQLHQATSSGELESIETFCGETSIGGGSVSMATKTLSRLCYGDCDENEDEAYMIMTPPVLQAVVPLCQIGSDTSGSKLLEWLEKSGRAFKNVVTKFAKEKSSKDTRTALAVLPIYQDGRRGCFFDAASNDSFSADQLLGMLEASVASPSAPELDVSQLTQDDWDDYQDRVVEAVTPQYGAFLFGYPHLLPKLQGSSLAKVLCEAKKIMKDGGIVALDLNGVPPPNTMSNPKTAKDLQMDPILGAALPYVDILHMNEEELQFLTGFTVQNTPTSKLEDEFHIASAIQLFLKNGVAMVAVTRGLKGCFVSCGDESRFAKSPALPSDWIDCTTKLPAEKLPAGAIINTNGAGDSFTAGLLVATMLRHTGVIIPSEQEAPPPPVSPKPATKQVLTPYQLYMRENYVSLKAKCHNDKRAIFSMCHELWEKESDHVKSMYERKAKEEEETNKSSNNNNASFNVLEQLEDGANRQKDYQHHYEMTNQTLTLDSAVKLATLTAAYHIHVPTRDDAHLNLSKLLEKCDLSRGSEEI